MSLSTTTHSATLARVFPFVIAGTITVNQVAMKTFAAGTNNIQLGIFSSNGTRLWTSGNQSTVAGIMTVTTSLPVTLTPGTYYFATTVGTATVSATAVYQTTPVFPSASVPRWGTVPATGGVMPTSIDPTSITETVGGFMTYTVLSNWTT